ncbi:MAG: hypothetical protein IJ518_08520 [Clostridia bacterium]|nr:hypothetical protein [Clostridia bacterium]
MNKRSIRIAALLCAVLMLAGLLCLQQPPAETAVSSVTQQGDDGFDGTEAPGKQSAVSATISGAPADAANGASVKAESTEYANIGENAFDSQPVSGKVKVTDYLRNPAVGRFPWISGYDEFYVCIKGWAYEPYSSMLKDWTVENLLLGTDAKQFDHNVETHEWTSNTVAGLLEEAKPATRQEALGIVFDFLRSETEGKDHTWIADESFMSYQHYAAEFGYDYIGCELGATVAGSNMRIAFTRGAAKQYNKALGTGNVSGWHVDFSAWHLLGMVNYSGNPMLYQDPDWLGSDDAVSSNEVSGQSVSAMRRHMYLAYMAGATAMIQQGAATVAFYNETDEDGNYLLSPHGKAYQEYYEFTQRNADRGDTYIPFGIVLDYYHGLPYGDWKALEVFEVFPLEAGDRMTQDLIQLLWPGGYPMDTDSDEAQLITSPYGETFDFLLQNASQTVLNSYQALILSGNIALSEEEVARYTAYVEQGGTLVLNRAYLDYFSGYDNGQEGDYTLTAGKGRVLVYGPEYSVESLDGILRQLVAEYIPFTISAGVDYVVNVKDGSLVLTLINNDGSVKYPTTAVQTDPTKAKEVTVRYTGDGEVLAVRDWMLGEPLEPSAEQVIVIGPGDLAILEFVI